MSVRGPRPTQSPMKRTGRSVRSLALVIVIALAGGVWQWSQRANPAPVAPPAAVVAQASPVAGTAYDLSRDERLGGHTLSRHVGRSEEALRDRLASEPGISAASTYTDRATAEQTVASAIAENETRVAVWLARQGNRSNLALDYRGVSAEPIGRSLQRGRRESVPCTDAVVVLRWSRNEYFVLTSYPEVRR